MAGENMNSPSFTNSWNTGTFLQLGGMLIAAAVGWGVITNKLDNIEKRMGETNAALTAEIAALKTGATPIPGLVYQASANAEAIKSIISRQESQTSNLSNQLREINTAIGGLQTSNAVILQRFDSLAPQQRTDLGRRMSVVGSK